MTEFEQTLLFAVTGVVLVGTLIVFVWQYIRMNRRDKDDDSRSRRSLSDTSIRPAPDSIYFGFGAHIVRWGA